MIGSLPAPAIDAIAQGRHNDPFSVLGLHELPGGGGLVIRAFLPYAASVVVQPAGGVAAPRPMVLIDPRGFFEAVYPETTNRFLYELEIVDHRGVRFRQYDPYQFGPRLSDYDLYLIGEGRHNRLYEKLGAHVTEMGGVTGVSFAVWAPNASRVSVVGDFNGWDGRIHPMRKHPANGIWEIFIPNARVGQRYKYEIKSPSGNLLALKSDPLAFEFEPDEPRTAAVISDLTYDWNDDAWMAERWRYQAHDAPVAIYEVHLGSWMRVPEEGGRWLTYTELADRLGSYVKEMGYTHIELLPITEHPFYASWGYQPIGMFAPTRRYGTPTEFMYFVDRMHQLGIGVILDWVPAHFPRDPNGLAYFDGTHLYEHADPRKAEHRDWGTLIYNYGRNEVANYLIASALFWLDRYHIDGLRVDAVASMLYLDYSRKPGEWIPNQFGGNENLEAIAFLKRMNEVTHGEHPGTTTIAEESTAFPGVSRPTYLGGLGFGYKWNMGWMHDMLSYMSKDPIHRKYHHNLLTFTLWYAWTENFILPLSHDEVVHMKGSLHGKMPGDDWQKFANLRAFYTYMYGHPGKKLLFMGGEFGQTREWNHDTSLDWHLLAYGPYHSGLQRLVKDLNRIYRECGALHELDCDPSGFQWIDHTDWEESIVAFLRRGHNPQDHLVFVSNFTPVVRYGYRIGVPAAGHYREILNSDSEFYGGSNVGNAGGVDTEPVPAHGHAQSICITLPPLATVVLQPAGTSE